MVWKIEAGEGAERRTSGVAPEAGSPFEFNGIPLVRV